MFDKALRARAEALVQRYAAQGRMVTTAESCTGGLVGALITEIPGASAVFERGFIVYSNAAKTELLGVPESLLAAHGAVSEECARALATGAIARSHADVAVSITGIAGPGGGSAQKPVGLVHFGVAWRGGEVSALRRLYGDLSREEIRRLSVEDALGLLERAAPQTKLA